MLTDNFNRVNGRLVNGWYDLFFQGNSDNDGLLNINTNQVVGLGAGYNLAYRYDKWSNDHASEVTLVNITGNSGSNFVGAGVRGSGHGMYVFFTDGSATGNFLRLLQPNAGGGNSFTDIHANISVTGGWANGDLLKLEAVGTTLNVYKNSVLVSSDTNATLTTGAPGLMVWNVTQKISFWTGTAASIVAASGPQKVSSVELINATALSTQTTTGFDSTGATALVVSINSHPVWPVSGGSNIVLSSVTDNKGNTYTLLRGPTDSLGGSFNLRSWVYYCNNPIVGTGHTITANFSAACPVVIFGFAASGTTPTSPNVFSPIAGGINTDSFSAFETCSGLLIGFCKAADFVTFNADLDGFQFDQNFTVNGVMQYQTGVTPGSYRAHVGLSASSNNQIVLVALSGAHYSVPDCRVPPSGPNVSRNVQGTLIYDVQTSSNPLVPSPDNRAGGPSVDSRGPGLAPQNSRAPGVFGPGE